MTDIAPDSLTVALHWRKYVGESNVVEEERPFAVGERGKVEAMRDSVESRSATHDRGRDKTNDAK